ncbi:MAG: DUF2232 domain-containing protein [Deltaproteobacteria bacterium]|nr:DUF2232 domain-containing protein [Deltaproteobacteria bacterium]
MKKWRFLAPLFQSFFYGATSALLFATLIGAVMSPAPLLYLYRRQGIKFLIIGFCAAALILGLLNRHVTLPGFYFLLTGGMLCCLLILLQRKQSMSTVILKTSLCLGVCLFLVFLGYYEFDLETFSLHIVQYVEQSRTILQTRSDFSQLVVQYPALAKFLENPHLFSNDLLKQVPGYGINFILFFVMINTLMLRKWKPELFSKNENILMWQVPDVCIWLFIACLSGVVLGYHSWMIFILNVLRILTFLYFIQGLAVIAFIFQKRKLKTFVQVLLLFLMSLITFPLPVSNEGLFYHVVLNIPMIIGFLDIWFRFRNQMMTPKRSPTTP